MGMTSFPIEVLGTTVPTKMWLWEHEVEPQAMQQVRAMAEHPYFDAIRVMPDAHFGKGAVVGSVIGSTSAICPSAVGVDIGCGVNAVKTNLTRDDVDDILHKLRTAIERAVPVGFNSHGEALSSKDLREIGGDKLFAQATRLKEDFTDLRAPGASKLEEKAGKQLGTLGGGNHFIELCTDADDNIWVTLHSGSRNPGKELAERHIEIAKTLPHNQDLPIKELAVFLKDTPEMLAYRNDLWWAQRFAATSRTIMMGLVKREISKVVPKARFEDEINCHHNYVAEETHNGVEMIVTRKGAISATKGELALIPGSMATGSYIVRGLGNEDSLTSASHGAGRKMSRGEAKRRFTVEDVQESMKGIEARKDAGVIDEIEYAYKNLDDVIAAQSNLVEIVQKLDTILCVKG